MKEKLGLFRTVWNTPYGLTTPFQLYDVAKEHRSFVQKLNLQTKLLVHNGCVNTICWNNSGEYILSGSDDQHLCVTHGYNYQIKTSVQTGHKANIFSARYLPNTGDNQVISCSGDGVIVHTSLDRPETSLRNIFTCHFGTAYEILTVPNDPNTFLSCGEDGTVRWFDLRIKDSCNAEECKEDVLITCHGAVTALAVSPFTPHHLGVGSSDGYVRIFDRRLLGTRATGSYSGGGMQAMITRFSVPEFGGRGRRITSLCYSPDGEEMLVSYSSDYVYLFEVKDNGVREPMQLEAMRFEKNGIKQQSQGKCSNKSFLGRLRVTGDWSDTGPSARSQNEIRESGEQPPRSLHSNLMQRMCDVLTRMFNSSSSSTTLSPSRPNSSSSENNQTVETTDPVDNSKVQKDVPVDIDQPNTSQNSAKLEKSTLVTSSSSSKNQKKFLESNKKEDKEQKVYVTESAGETSKKLNLNQSVKSLQSELSSRRRNFLEKHNLEPVINLHYNGQGVSSGLITMGLSDVRDREHLNLQQSEVVNDSVDDETIEERSSASDLRQNDISRETNVEDQNVRESSDGESENDDEKQAFSSPVKKTLSERLDSRETLLMDKRLPSRVVDEWDDSNDSEEETATKRNKIETSQNYLSENLSPKEQLDSHKRMDFEDIQMMKVPEPRIKKRFTGHRNSRTMIKEATFWGNDFVMSGSDCGHIFIWDRYTSQLIMVLEADNHVVNCLQPHPFDPILASSGIDHDIKIWAPLQQEAVFDEKKAKEIVGRNEVMLEETKDTITVPASFMIRMLASLNNLRSAGGISGWRRLMREDRQPSNNET